MADTFFGLTDIGKLRDTNEDVFMAQPLSNGWLLACVIDGVGGYEGGEIAAAIAKETILQLLQKPFTDALATLKAAVLKANINIYTEKQKAGTNKDMACVLTIALADVANNIFYYAHVGDTRMYLLRDSSLVKVTKDQSFVGFLEDSGRLSEKEAMQHPKRNEINKALGFDGAIEKDEEYVETGSSPFLPGDVLLLCSDGLTDLVTAKSMTDILLADTSLQQKVEGLIAAANKAGGKDNITVVLVVNTKKPLKQKATKPIAVAKKAESVGEEPVAVEATKEPAPIIKKRRSGMLPVLLLSLLCLGLGATTYWFWKQNKELIKPALVPVKRVPNEMEKRLRDSLAIASKRLLITDSIFGQNIIIGDTMYIRQDSLHIIGNGSTLQSDSSYHGPAFFVTANCKYLLLENIIFNDFTTAIITQSKGLQLKKIVFHHIAVPIQQNHLISLNDTVTGILRDSFLFKKDSTHK